MAGKVTARPELPYLRQLTIAANGKTNNRIVKAIQGVHKAGPRTYHDFRTIKASLIIRWEAWRGVCRLVKAPVSGW